MQITENNKEYYFVKYIWNTKKINHKVKKKSLKYIWLKLKYLLKVLKIIKMFYKKSNLF